MNSVDTNIVVRLLTQDDPKQTTAVKSLFAAGPIWIAKTVLLEAAWVLRNFYDFTEAAIRDSLAGLVGLENVYTEDKDSIVAALELAAHGVELEDAIHYASRPPGAIFVSFDQAFLRRAKRAGATHLSGLPLTN